MTRRGHEAVDRCVVTSASPTIPMSVPSVTPSPSDTFSGCPRGCIGNLRPLAHCSLTKHEAAPLSMRMSPHSCPLTVPRTTMRRLPSCIGSRPMREVVSIAAIDDSYPCLFFCRVLDGCVALTALPSEAVPLTTSPSAAAEPTGGTDWPSSFASPLPSPRGGDRAAG
jgi:hypothetical protein